MQVCTKDSGLALTFGNKGIARWKTGTAGDLELTAPLAENDEWETTPSEETDGLELPLPGQR